MTVHRRGLLLARRLERDRLRRLVSAYSRGKASDRLFDGEPPVWRRTKDSNRAAGHGKRQADSD